MWVEVKRRIIDILKTLTAPDGTDYIIADFMPKSRSDLHGYLITVRPNRDTATPSVAQGINPHVLNFIIEVTSQQINTNSEVIQEYRIEAYADAITVLLDRYPFLNDPDPDALIKRQGLDGVSKIIVGGATFQTPRPYPQGGVINHYSFTLNVQVPYERVTGC